MRFILEKCSNPRILSSKSVVFYTNYPRKSVVIRAFYPRKVYYFTQTILEKV